MILFRGGEGFELRHFRVTKGPEFARRDVEDEWAELDALDFFHAKADVLKHPANLAIAALDQNDFVPGIGHIFD